jgi:hypothetical protein
MSEIRSIRSSMALWVGRFFRRGHVDVHQSDLVYQNSSSNWSTVSKERHGHVCWCSLLLLQESACDRCDSRCLSTARLARFLQRSVDRSISRWCWTSLGSGISASYVGVSETIVHFVIYEYVKARLQSSQNTTARASDDPGLFDFVSYLTAAACSKSCASTLCYPHEVVRTRLREEGNKYRTFTQTCMTVYREERLAGLYRGLLTHLIRQIPVISRPFDELVRATRLSCRIRQLWWVPTS